MGKHEPIATRERVAKRREALRAAGLRPKQFWVPDTQSAAFIEQARRDCDAINASAELSEIMDFVEAVQIWPD